MLRHAVEFRRKVIVVGESNYLTAHLLMAAVQAAGHTAFAGRTGDEIKELLRTHDADLVLLNLNLARPSGIELLRALQHQFAHIPIVAAAAAGQSEMKIAAASLGVASFFELPFSPVELTNLLSPLME